jgi:hypothetical protein
MHCESAVTPLVTGRAHVIVIYLIGAPPSVLINATRAVEVMQ